MEKTCRDFADSSDRTGRSRQPPCCQGKRKLLSSKKTPTPTVIVECGFLSNPTEAELLLQDDYQDQLVNAIYTGIETYLEKNSRKANHRNYSNSRIVFKNASAIWYKRAVCTLYTESSFSLCGLSLFIHSFFRRSCRIIHRRYISTLSRCDTRKMI